MNAIELSTSTSTSQPCISFPKVPVPSCPPKSLPSKGGGTLRLHSIMSDMMPTRPSSHTRSAPISADAGDPVLVDDDYDNHIRFPRISNLRNYVHTNSPRRLLIGQTSTRSSHSLDSKYTPAAFDLAAPLRRYSVAEEPRVDVSILEYVADNYMYERGSLDKLEKLASQTLRNMPSFGLSATSQSAACRRASISSGKWSSSGLYEMKKPLIMPAVLRPNNSGGGSSHNAQLDPRTLQDLKNYRVTTEEPNEPLDPESRNTSSAAAATFKILGEESAVADAMDMSPAPSLCESWQRKATFTKEPTHAHWQLTTGSTHCTRCLKTFRGLVASRLSSWWEPQPRLIDSKHHCRFCGVLVCRDCLAQSELSPSDARDAIVLDGHARFVVPMHTAGETEHPLANPENFKLVKICKHCAQMYRHVVDVLNEQASVNRANFAPGRATHVFIENPHIAKKMPQNPSPQRHVTQAEIKRQSIVEDWTWSSF